MVRQKVASGLYTSASEVVREALRMMEAQDQLRAAKLEQLRQDIREGLESGESTPWDAEEIKQEGRQRRAVRANSNQELKYPHQDYGNSDCPSSLRNPVCFLVASLIFSSNAINSAFTAIKSISSSCFAVLI